jgi:phosphoribosyl 1,2-cyclic phosphodiesterase/ActR/RegA family two-component response regulator
MKRVLLMDDDRVFRKMLTEVFAGQGWQVFEAEDGEKGLDLGRLHHPDLVICDLFMPRVNGFTVCRAIRAERESFPSTRVIITSGSVHKVDRDDALKAGADDYFTKPVRVSDLLASAGNNHKALDAPAPTEPSTAIAIPLENNDTLIRLWGVRGSIPTPGPKTAYYGGNTSCVEVRADGEIIILDAGTGIRNLGIQLAAEFKDRPLALTVLITHTHWDHIQGFPFFPPAYDPRNNIRVLSFEGARKGLQATLESQMESPYFPISMQQMPGTINIEELKDMSFSVGRVRVQATFTNHPGVCAGYRLFTSGGSLAYLPDNELFHRFTTTSNKGAEAHRFGAEQDENLRKFLEGVDVLIIDSQYDPNEYPRYVGWGHSCFEDTVDLAMRARVKELLLFHHDPNHEDTKISQMLGRAREIAKAAGSDLRVEAAREGLEIVLPAGKLAGAQ